MSKPRESQPPPVTPKPAPPAPRWRLALDILHKLLTAGAALAAILKLFF
jgi:hypothetical protein